jgi:hypothetical protein
LVVAEVLLASAQLHQQGLADVVAGLTEKVVQFHLVLALMVKGSQVAKEITSDTVVVAEVLLKRGSHPVKVHRFLTEATGFYHLSTGLLGIMVLVAEGARQEALPWAVLLVGILAVVQAVVHQT